MILLGSDDKLQVLLAGSVATTQPVLYAAYADHAPGSFTPGNVSGATNSTTAVDWVSSPSMDVERQIKYLSLYNADTASVVATVRVVDGANNRVLLKVTLAVGERLEFTDGEGFKVITTNGATKVAITDSGYIVGPSSSVTDRIAVFDGVTGKLAKDGGKTIAEVITAARAPNIVSAITSGTITPAGDTDLLRPAALSAALTIANPSSTPTDGAGFVVDLIDNGTTRALTWDTKYANRMATLPTATTAGKRHRIGVEYNAADDKLYCMYAQVQS